MTHGACASGDEYSARAGVDVLAAGGNAVDAAVASGLVACVTLPTMTGLGGGGLMTVLIDGHVVVCDFFANVPGLDLERDGTRELDIVRVDFEGIFVDFRVRAPSIAVPGTVAGLWAVHQRHGRMPLAEVARPAIDAAREGFVATRAQHQAFRLLDEIFRMTPEAWALVSPGGDAVAVEGDVLRNPDLAHTLEHVVREGPEAFYGGEIGAAIVEAAEGWVTPRDLAAYRPAFREPATGAYRGWSVHVPAMPSVTGGMVLRALECLEAEGSLPRDMDVQAWGRLIEAMRLAESVRTEEYERRLFEDGYVQSLLAGCPGGNTMHLSTADGDGGMVAYTTTVGESAGLVAPRTGVVLNNFLGEEDILPVGGMSAAGRRMMTSMCPTILESPGGRAVALGSAGSARIKSAILQVIMHLVDGGAGPAEAIRRPRVHAEGKTLYIEGHGRTQEEVGALRRLASHVETTWECGFFFGGAQAVERGPEGLRVGADEDRRGCRALVV